MRKISTLSLGLVAFAIIVLIAGLFVLTDEKPVEPVVSPTLTQMSTVTVHSTLTPSSTLTLPTVTPSPTVTETHTPEPPTPTPELAITPAGIPPEPGIIFEMLSLWYDPSLAESWSGIVVAEQPDQNQSGNVNPTHVRIDFESFVVSSDISPQIYIYPIAEISPELSPAHLKEIEELQGFLQARPAVVQAALEPGAGIPVLPFGYGCVQTLRARIAYMDFQTGTGIRFLTDFRCDASPIRKNSLFYTFQGLTHEKAYYIAVVLPITHPSLPDEDDVILETRDYEQYVENYPIYLEGLSELLVSAESQTFEPDLNLLDSLVQSIHVQH